MIRVRFPDNLTLEATFHPSETIQSLFDLLTKVVARPDLSFYLCEDALLHVFSFFLVSSVTKQAYEFVCAADTTPPKKQVKDLSQDFYSAGFVPGAIVYFAYDVPKGIIFAY